MIPFISYYILPTQAIVRNNVHSGHVRNLTLIVLIKSKFKSILFYYQIKEDIEALLLALSPILYIFHRDIPKPHVLHPNVIQNLAIRVLLIHL